jgi:glucose-1-phosphate cytidylyltransferase
MKTVILCGGIGYRLKEETEFKPKPMVLIGNKPILWHIMKIYASQGFNEFIIALGYKGDYIKDYFLNQQYFIHDFSLNTKSGITVIYKEKTKNNLIDDFNITFVDTGPNTLAGERILRIKEYISEADKDFMVTYGDGVGNINLQALLELHKKNKTIGTITGVHPRSKYGLVKVGNRCIVEEFKEKPVLKDWVNGGYMVFTKEFFKYLKIGKTEHPALNKIAKKKSLSIYKHRGFWHSMDTYTDVENLNIFWKNNPEWKIWKD